MSIEKRIYTSRSRGGRYSKMTECPRCGEELEDGEGFVHHWPDCPENNDGVEA